MTRRRDPRGTRKGFMDLYIHTRATIRDRYNVDLTEEGFAQMGEMIRRREAKLVLKQTRSRSIFKLEMPFGTVFAVYNKELSQVCTVLEPYMVEQQVRQHRPMEA